jgi:hypothetical protein
MGRRDIGRLVTPEFGVDRSVSRRRSGSVHEHAQLESGTVNATATLSYEVIVRQYVPITRLTIRVEE